MLIPHKGDNKILITYNPPRVVISTLAHQKMSLYIELHDKEIGWLGSVVQHENMLYINDVYLFKQQVHSTTCELTAESLGEFATDLLSKPDGVDLYNSMRLWGHSHVDMGVGASGQDDSQVNVFKNNGCLWFLRCIGNKRGQMQFTYYDWSNGIQVNDISWEIEQPVYDGLRDQVKAEIDDKVTEFATVRSYKVFGSDSEEYGICSGVGYWKNGLFHNWETSVIPYVDYLHYLDDLEKDFPTIYKKAVDKYPYLVKDKAKEKKKEEEKQETETSITKMPGFFGMMHPKSGIITAYTGSVPTNILKSHFAVFHIITDSDINSYFEEDDLATIAMLRNDNNKAKLYIEDILMCCMPSNIDYYGEIEVTNGSIESIIAYAARQELLKYKIKN